MIYLGYRIKLLKKDVTLIYDAHEYLKGWPLYKESKKNFTKIKSYLVWKKNLVNEKKALKQVDYILTISQGMAISFKNDHKLRYTPIVLKNIPEKQKKYKNQKYFHKKFNLDVILG